MGNGSRHEEKKLKDKYAGSSYSSGNQEAPSSEDKTSELPRARSEEVAKSDAES